jgi:outer membrane murein-binding lipoprotein Lpp
LATVPAMSRAVVAGVALISVALAGCSGSGNAIHPFGAAPACPLLAQLARTGESVEHADVSDPDTFDATLRSAVVSYVHTAKRLRTAVPARLRADVDRMISAAQAHRFSDAESARSDIDAYARSVCKSI